MINDFQSRTRYEEPNYILAHLHTISDIYPHNLMNGACDRSPIVYLVTVMAVSV